MRYDRTPPRRTFGPLARRVLLLAVAGGALLGCAATNNAVQDRPKPRWPAPPLAARIEWVGEVRNPQDFGIEKGFWRRVLEAVTGEKKELFERPYGVLADGHDRLVVVDTGGGTVHIYDRGTRRHTAFGQGGPLRLQAPIAAAEDESGNLYITDSAAAAVYRYELQTGKLRLFASRPLGRPTGVAYSGQNGLLYVSDTLAHQIVAFRPDGSEALRIGTRNEGGVGFNFPTDLHVDAKGQLYVTDALNHRILMLQPDGQFVAAVGSAGDIPGYFAKPKGVAVDSEGHVYAVDALMDAVQIYAPTGELLLVFGGHGTGPGEFWMPAGISIDPNDTVYVVDVYNKRVQLFRYLREETAASTDAAGRKVP